MRSSHGRRRAAQTRRVGATATAALAFVALSILPAAGYLRPGITERVSVAPDGSLGDDESWGSGISADGSYVVFGSRAANLVPNDDNQEPDVFVRDLETGITERVSVASDGAEADGGSFGHAISANGRYVAFGSGAANLVQGDTNGESDVFVHDRQTGHTERVSVASDGRQANAWSSEPTISADGRFVAFVSGAYNLVPGDIGEVDMQLFLHDRQTGSTERVAVASDGTPANGRSFSAGSLSADGRFVAFVSRGTNLVSGDTNETVDIFVRDREAGTTERVSVASDGAEADNASHEPTISADGRFVSFKSEASNLVPNDTFHGHDSLGFDDIAYDAFVHDRETGVTERVSVASDGTQADEGSDFVTLSAEGRFVAFQSAAGNLVPGDTKSIEIFVHDRVTGATERVTEAIGGGELQGAAFAPSISADGRVVAFEGIGTNLVPGESDDEFHVFARDRGAPLGVVGELAVTEVSGGARVSGLASLSGDVITEGSDPGDDALIGTRELGAELTGFSVAYRPELKDLFVRWHVASLPSSIAGLEGGGIPGMVYAWRMELDRVRYEVRAHWASAASEPPGAPHVALYRCDPVDLDGELRDCTEQARLGAGFGTTGNQVTTSVPLEAFTYPVATGIEEGDRLLQMRAFTAPDSEIGNHKVSAIDEVTFDEMTFPGAMIPASRVELGISAAGASEDEVSFDWEAGLSQGSFSGVVPVDPSAGPQQVWARVCLGWFECGPAVSRSAA